MEHVSKLLPAIAEEKQIRKSDLRLIEAAAVIRQEPITDEDRAYMARELVQCTLPHRDPGDVARWSRRNGNLTLTVVSSVGYPYGSIPRLLLYWLTQQAKQTGSRRIKLGESYREFLRAIGLTGENGSGARGDKRRVKKQTRRLFGSMISFSQGDSCHEKRWNMVVASRSELWWDPVKPDQVDLFGSWVELGQDFYEAITADCVPLDCRVLRGLKRSPLALDLYAWAAHKAYYVRQKQQMQFVPWKGLHQQFGSDYTDIFDFRKKALAALRKIAVLYPGFHFEVIPYGLMILPTCALSVAPKLRAIAEECPIPPGQEPCSPYL
jgi:hypothetical protein